MIKPSSGLSKSRCWRIKSYTPKLSPVTAISTKSNHSKPPAWPGISKFSRWSRGRIKLAVRHASIPRRNQDEMRSKCDRMVARRERRNSSTKRHETPIDNFTVEVDGVGSLVGFHRESRIRSRRVRALVQEAVSRVIIQEQLGVMR